MKLYLYGHSYKYAVEQMLLTLFPTERPEYPEGRPEGEYLSVKLGGGEEYVTAACKLSLNGEMYYGRAQARKCKLISQVMTDRICQSLVKDAIYRAALAGGLKHPAWGSLSGVRPGKVFSPLLLEGHSPADAMRIFMDKYDVTEKRAKLCRDTSIETVKAIKSLDRRDVCLYVGIPFCPTRCAYCSFVSQSVEKSMKLIPPFLEALHKEIETTAQVVRENSLRVISVYIGGGTPTTLSASQLGELCTHLEQSFDLSAVKEFTVEAGRPDTITEDKLRVLRSHGVDRVSVNPQTMDDHVLAVIGRKHTAQDILDALGKVRAVGGFAVNMDLIAGLPDDSVTSFRDTLDKVLALAPENVTVHTLALKKGSRITLEGTSLPTDGQVEEMLDISQKKLSEAGYKPYYLYRQKFMSGGFENVGWAKEGYVNLYNICIMEELCSVIALGGGGSTKLICPGDGRNIRLCDPKYPLEYINGIAKICTDKQKITGFYHSEVD